MDHITIMVACLTLLAIFTLFSLKKESENSYSMSLKRIAIIIFFTGLLAGYDIFYKNE